MTVQVPGFNYFHELFDSDPYFSKVIAVVRVRENSEFVLVGVFISGKLVFSGFSPFQVVYSIIPRSPIDLVPLSSKTRVHGKAEDFVHSLQEVHKQVQENLPHSAERYKLAADKKRRHLEFDVGNFVWAILTKDRFAVGEYHKLAARKIGPLEILEKINPNAYRLKLPTHIRTHDVFNIKHLIPFRGDSSDDEAVGNSRSNFLQPGENDVAAIDDLALEFMEG
ncbi:hypothetical protein ACOSP7_013884 [Xanthoceras sorbifolium]